MCGNQERSIAVLKVRTCLPEPDREDITEDKHDLPLPSTSRHFLDELSFIKTRGIALSLFSRLDATKFRLQIRIGTGARDHQMLSCPCPFRAYKSGLTTRRYEASLSNRLLDNLA